MLMRSYLFILIAALAFVLIGCEKDKVQPDNSYIDGQWQSASIQVTTCPNDSLWVASYAPSDVIWVISNGTVESINNGVSEQFTFSNFRTEDSITYNPSINPELYATVSPNELTIGFSFSDSSKVMTCFIPNTINDCIDILQFNLVVP